jgi:hypothetical protein
MPLPMSCTIKASLYLELGVREVERHYSTGHLEDAGNMLYRTVSGSDRMPHSTVLLPRTLRQQWFNYDCNLSTTLSLASGATALGSVSTLGSVRSQTLSLASGATALGSVSTLGSVRSQMFIAPSFIQVSLCFTEP